MGVLNRRTVTVEVLEELSRGNADRLSSNVNDESAATAT